MSARPFNRDSTEEREIARYVASMRGNIYRDRSGGTISIEDVLAHGLIDVEGRAVWVGGIRTPFPPLFPDTEEAA